MKASADLPPPPEKGEIEHAPNTRLLTLHGYLGVPPPRTTRVELVKQMLEEQYPGIVKSSDIAFIDFQGGKFKKYR